MIRKKVGSITLAVALITMGVLLFARNFMDLPIKDIYKYWPVLLIGLGLEMVLYMVFYGRNNTEVKLSIDGLCIAAIIVLGLLSSGAGFINMGSGRLFFFQYPGNSIIDGIKYRSQVTETYVKDNISGSFNMKELKVNNSFGDIKVRPAEAKGIRIEADITVKCNDEEKAREYARNAIEIKEGEITEISPRTPDARNKKDYSAAIIDFVIYVPKNIKVNVVANHGDISAEGVEGECVLENRNGKIEAENITGNINMDNSFGDIRVRNVQGNAVITNKNGEIYVDRISGGTTIEGSFGDIEVTAVGGDLKIVSSNGEITVSDVSGKAELVNSFGDISIDKVRGDITVENKNGRISAEGASGNVKIENSFGDIYLRSSNIDNGDLYARTMFGEIECKKPLRHSKEGQETIAQGRFGSGKYRIELMTKNGDIVIE